MRLAYTQEDGTAVYYHPLRAGWDYGASGQCRCPVTRQDYPWHESYVGKRHDMRGKCVRCGEREPAVPRYVYADGTPVGAVAAGKSG